MTNKENFISTFKLALRLKFGKNLEEASDLEKYTALSETIMELIADKWKETGEAYRDKRQAYYFSAEFLVGRSLYNNLVNLLLEEDVREILESLNMDLD